MSAAGLNWDSFTLFQQNEECKNWELRDYKMQWTVDWEKIGMRYDNMLYNISKILSSIKGQIQSTRTVVLLLDQKEQLH